MQAPGEQDVCKIGEWINIDVLRTTHVASYGWLRMGKLLPCCLPVACFIGSHGHEERNQGFCLLSVSRNLEFSFAHFTSTGELSR
jgi:hypothetical protein